jgi:hypothetical protein
MANLGNLTPEIIKARKETIIALLKEGLSYTKSLEAAKCSSQTAANWRKADLTFDEAVTKYLTNRPRTYANQGRLPSRSHEKVDEDERADVIEQLCNAIRGGLPVDMCCLLVNINKGALVEWMTRDPEIQAKVNKAQAQNLLWWISKLRQGAERDWRAAIAYLERVFPHLFAEVKAVDVSVRTEDKQQNMVIDVTPDHVLHKMMEMSDDELMKMAGIQ